MKKNNKHQHQYITLAVSFIIILGLLFHYVNLTTSSVVGSEKVVNEVESRKRFTCSDWCDEGHHGNGVIIGTSFLCDAECYKDCPNSYCQYASRNFVLFLLHSCHKIKYFNSVISEYTSFNI